MRVVIDLYGTLVRQPQQDHARILGEIAEHYLGTDPGEFAAAFQQTAPVREHASWTFVPALMRAAQDAGQRPSLASAQAMYRECVRIARSHLETALHPAAVDTIAQLRGQGHAPWGCANASGDTAAALPGSPLSHAMDGIVVSADLGLTAPHPGSYWAADPAGGGAYASASVVNLEGARAARRHPVQVPLLGEDGGVAFEAGWDGLRIADLSHLPALMRAVAWPGVARPPA